MFKDATAYLYRTQISIISALHLSVMHNISLTLVKLVSQPTHIKRNESNDVSVCPGPYKCYYFSLHMCVGLSYLFQSRYCDLRSGIN